MTNRKKYIFLDRDGTIIHDGQYTHKIEDLLFLPRAIEGLQKLTKDGYSFIIVTNQAGIARGKYTEEQAHIFNKEMERQLAEHGIRIDRTYMCIHHPDVTGECSCRKPYPGLVHQAAQEFSLNPSLAVFVGDKDCDIDLGKQFGATTFLVDNEQYEVRSIPDHKIRNLTEISEILKKKKPANG